MVAGVATVTFEFGKRQYTHDAYVVDGLRAGVLLGSDFLRKYRGVLDYNHEVITYDGQAVPLVDSETLPVSKRTSVPVTLMKNVRVRAGQTEEVWARVPRGMEIQGDWIRRHYQASRSWACVSKTPWWM